ncbi:hypothetical protein ABPG75_010776 [Micractinium tetrahymenae]
MGVQPSPRLPPASRRGLLLSVPLLALPHVPRRAKAATPAPILDQPMQRLRLPQGTVGRDYVLLQLKLGGKGPFDFVVDTGLTAEMITPHLRQVLGIPPSRQRLETGFGAGGSVLGAELVELKDATLAGADGLPLPPLTAVVTDFIQEHMDPAHDPVEGMLGQELLSLFDLDLDFRAGRLRLYRPGDGVAAAAAAGLVEVPAAVLNETGVLGIRATSPAAAQRGGQPFVGILDCGASFSALNWKAAVLAGLPPKGDAAYNTRERGVAIVGVDGKPQVLPTTSVQFSFAGAPHRAEGGGGLRFDPPPAGWRPWDPVTAAVGELPVFSLMLGDGSRPYEGPAALLGLDVLSQRRVVISAGAGRSGRARQLWVSAT